MGKSISLALACVRPSRRNGHGIIPKAMARMSRAGAEFHQRFIKSLADDLN